MTARRIGVRELASRSHYSAGYISNLRSGRKQPSPQCGAELDHILRAAGELAALAASLPEHGHAPEPLGFPDLASAAHVQPFALTDLAVTDEVSPVEHLIRLRSVISEHDNIFGPRTLIPVVRDQLALIHQLRDSRNGADGSQLLMLQAQYAETLAWLYQDSTDFRSARFYLDRALEWAHMAGDLQWAAFVLARKSQLAGDMHDPASAVDLAEAAARLARNATRLRAAGAAYQAHGHALAGNPAACLRTLDEAHEIAAGPDDHPSVPWAGWLSTRYVDIQRARCMDVLGRHPEAARLFDEAITDIPPALRRDRGVYLARQAVAYAGAADLDSASRAGIRAARIARITGSGRIVVELRRLDTSLRRSKTGPARDFHEAFAGLVPQQARAGRSRPA